MRWLFVPILSVIGLVVAHWTSLRLYLIICSPDGWSGLLTSFIIAPSTWCYSLLNLHVKISEWYTMWAGQFMVYVIATGSVWAGNLLWKKSDG